MSSENYWQDRLDDIKDECFSEKNLKKMYRESFKRMKKEIDTLYIKTLSGKNLTRSELYKFSHYLSMKKAIKKECNVNTVRLNKEVEKTLKKAYKKTFKSTKYFFKDKTPFNMVDNKRVATVLKTNWSGQHFSERIWKNNKRLSKDLEEIIADCLIRGKSKAEAIELIQLRSFVEYNKAERLVRTEMSQVVNRANLDAYKDYGCDEVRILCERKQRTCDFCRDRHHKEVEIKGARVGVDIPPFHPNCYCDIAPIIKIEGK